MGDAFDAFAVTAPGLEEFAAGELRALGIEARPEPGGVGWSASWRDLYRANLHVRTASRVVVRASRFRARSFIEMERHVRRIDWTPYIARGSAVRLRVTSRKSRLYHERAIEERFGRFIGDAVGATVGPAREDDDEGPDDAGSDAARVEDGDGSAAQLVIVRFLRDECVVSVDSSGALLHRRGYRQAVAKAPLRETIAAGILLAGGWDGRSPLIDPFCGSGTIPIEAALIARQIPPGLATAGREPRGFAFQRWPSHEPAAWERLVAAARGEIRDGTGVIIVGTDRDAGAIEAARSNAARAGLEDDLTFDARPISALVPPRSSSRGWIVTNPPYGVRVGEADALRDLYTAFGRVVRDRLPGWTVAMLSSNDALARRTGLPALAKLATRNGGIPVKLLVSRMPGPPGDA